MGHRQSKNQRSPALPKTDKRAKERSSKRASALRSSIIIRIRMLKMESKDLTNNLNVKCDDQKSKCSCNDNNGHQSTNTTFNNQNTTITTLPSSVHNQYIQPDAQSNKMNNEEIEHLEDRINQINNDNSTTFVARRNQYNNRSTNNINNNIINDNETNSDAIGRIDTEINVSAICDNVTSESDRIQMELKNIGVNNYKRSNLLMHRGCDNKMLLSSFDQPQFVVDGVPANTKPMNNSSIYPNANNATAVTTPSTSKGPDYIPMAPIKTSDKIATEQNALMSSELANSLKQMGLPSTEDCTKDPKDKETKSKITNWSKKFNCVKMLSPKSSSHIHHHHQQQQLLQPSSSRSHRQNGVTDTNNSIVKHADTRILSDHHRMAAEAVRRLLDFDKFNPLDYPTEDCDEVARVQRAREINEGVDPPPGYRTICADPLYVAADPALDNRLSTCSADDKEIMNAIRSIPDGHIEASGMLNTSDTFPNNMFSSVEQQPRVIHSQVDFIHCLVPDLRKITNCGFYWGVMDRYEAERLLEGKPEGTFLLRDSAQEEFLFSVSFRKYGRSLHARIEQFNHKFSFDCHDPGVFTSPEVTGLLEHYKDPACVMFFEPALTQPLNRNFCFTLQQLCRSLIVSSTTYDGVNELPLPSTLKSYLKEYHYKQRVRVRRYDQ